MSTDLFQALTLGLLVIVILALLVAVSMLGKIRAAIEGRTTPGAAGDGAGAHEATAAATVSDAVAEVTGAEPEAEADRPVVVTEGEDLSAAAVDEVAAGEGTEEDSERPFERGGRWYFRRAGELLVYEEGTGEWVPADGGQEQTAEPAVERQAEEIEASSEPTVAEASEEERPAAAAEPSTSFAGQPLATAEEEVATLGGDSVGDDDAAVAAGFEEPGGGTVDLEEAATVEEPARHNESFWKCASCGAINGSTASTCRMCFAARP